LISHPLPKEVKLSIEERIMSLSELKDVILQLSFEERAELNRLLYGWEQDEWDKQMAEDIAAGRLDEIIARAEADLKAGRVRELP
jgi:hypothetical protein